MEERHFLLYGIIKTLLIMKVEKLIDIINEIDDILHRYGIIVDHDILTHHILKAIKESYPNENIELEYSNLNFALKLKTIPEIV